MIWLSAVVGFVVLSLPGTCRRCCKQHLAWPGMLVLLCCAVIVGDSAAAKKVESQLKIVSVPHPGLLPPRRLHPRHQP